MVEKGMTFCWVGQRMTDSLEKRVMIRCRVEMETTNCMVETGMMS